MVSYSTASFLTQADALFRKNLIYQRRNIRQNIGLTIFPALLCLLIITIQSVVNNELDKPRYHCGCKCIDTNGTGTCHKVCGVHYSTSIQAVACPVRQPQEWPALLQVPNLKYRAVKEASHRFPGLPNRSCFRDGSCPVTSLFTGQNKTIARDLVKRILSDSIPVNEEDISNFVSLSYLGTSSAPASDNFVERALLSNSSLHLILPHCLVKFNITVSVTIGNVQKEKVVDCLQSQYLWRKNSSYIDAEVYQGYRNGNSAQKINEYVGAYDFLNTTQTNFNIILWHNSTHGNHGMRRKLLRIPKTLNMVSNAFLRQYKSSKSRVLLSYLKEMPKTETKIAMDLTELLGPLLYAWVIQLLLPVFIIALVHDKQHKLRTMMKVHGLGDGPYWLISYCHFLSVSFLYMLWLTILGSIIGLDIFRLNSYSIQFLFYGLYINLQIALAFLAGIGFSDIHNAAVVGYIYVFGSGLLGSFLFQICIERPAFSRRKLIIMEIIPGFSLYRGLYELSQFAIEGHHRGTYGMQWKNLSDENNGIKDVLVIMAIEWLFLLYVSYYLDQLVSTSSGSCRSLSIFTRNFRNGSIQPTIPTKIPSSTIIVDQDDSDIYEAYRVERLLNECTANHPIVCSNLEKVYTGKDGNPNKQAVHNLSLAVAKGECLGMLGPNGSGKTTVINMMIGLLQPTSGTVFLSNKNINSSLNNIHAKIGICPQKDFLWNSLTGREHLNFYGRLRNLKGSALQNAVDSLMTSLDLHKSNIGDQLVGAYSGGMKRRLSVAISLIGDTQVVLLDEPTTGLDPDSRNYLWQAINFVKRDRAIILTTHSMEEAEFLCDRLAIIVNGKLRCLGTSNEGSFYLDLDKYLLPDLSSRAEDEIEEFTCIYYGISISRHLLNVKVGQAENQTENYTAKLEFADYNNAAAQTTELKARYGGSYQLTISADPLFKTTIENAVTSLCSDATKIYDVVGTQRYRLPRKAARIQEILQTIKVLKGSAQIHAFELTSASLEDVFGNVVDHALETETD